MCLCVFVKRAHRNECGHIIGSLGWATFLSGKRYFIQPFSATEETQLIDKLFLKCGFAVGHENKTATTTKTAVKIYGPVFKYWSRIVPKWREQNEKRIAIDRQRWGEFFTFIMHLANNFNICCQSPAFQNCFSLHIGAYLIFIQYLYPISSVRTHSEYILSGKWIGLQFVWRNQKWNGNSKNEKKRIWWPVAIANTSLTHSNNNTLLIIILF